MNLKVYSGRVIAWSILIDVLINSLWVAHLLPSIAYRRPLTIALVGARVVVTALEFTAARFLLNGRDDRLALARRVLLASASLVTVEVGLRLVPTNLDPTFKWWVVVAYWAYALAAQWILRPSASNR